MKYHVQEDWDRTTLPHNIGQILTVMDPHERKSIFVSYFSGQRTFSSRMFHANMTEEEEWVTSEYYFNLEYNSPAWWDYPQVTWLTIIQLINIL